MYHCSLKSLIKLYEKCKKFLKGEEEAAKWAAIDMTEESETEGDEIRQHTLKWRSEGGLHIVANFFERQSGTLGGARIFLTPPLN